MLGAQVKWFVYWRLGAVRMFDVVLSWLASAPALSDLGRCLERTQQRSMLCELSVLGTRLFMYSNYSINII